MNTKLPSPDCACGCRRKAEIMGYNKVCLDTKAARGDFDETVQKGIERAERVKKGRVTR